MHFEHFADGEAAVGEMSRVLREDGVLAMSIDALSHADRWPELDTAHRRRYSVVRAYDRDDMRALLERQGLRLEQSRYIFRGWAERLYLTLSKHRLAWNLAAPLAPIIAASDRMHEDTGGSILLICARRV